MDEVRAIELRRLRELEKQAAHLGPKTDPAVLIEIQDIRRRYPDAPQSRRRRSYTGDLDLDWFSNALAAALRRITVVEGRQTEDVAERKERQRETDAFREQQALSTQRLSDDFADLKDWVKAALIIAIVALVVSVVVAIAVF
jgi:hypothetical protein